MLDQPLGSLAKSAIELGCGLGIVSLTLAHLDVCVESTDRELKALLLTEEAADFNGLSGLTTGMFEWSEDDKMMGSPFLLCSDLLYENTSAEILFDLIHRREALDAHGTLVLGCPTRRIDYLDELVSRLREKGYTHESVEFSVDWSGHVEVVAVQKLVRGPIERHTY